MCTSNPEILESNLELWSGAYENRCVPRLAVGPQGGRHSPVPASISLLVGHLSAGMMLDNLVERNEGPPLPASSLTMRAIAQTQKDNEQNDTIS